jgi:hypothetical protein
MRSWLEFKAESFLQKTENRVAIKKQQADYFLKL